MTRPLLPALLGLALVTGAAPASAAPNPCGGAFTQHRAGGDGDVVCTCGRLAPAPVWGTSTYTADSDLCAAAAHAGAIPATGGEVRARRAAGCAGYRGSFAHGVPSGAWGAFEASFFFPGHGDGACVLPDPDACPLVWAVAPGHAPGVERTCACGSSPGGEVFGTAIYTADSSVCAAAVHAGAVTRGGGRVTIRGAGGCGGYSGTAANGVTSRDWGAYGESFFFPGHGDGACRSVGTLCPQTFEQIGAELPAVCTCAGAEQGAIYGTGVYTADSVICVAARHAGVVGARGGEVRLVPVAGCHHYEGSARNGVTSRAWNAYERSFTFRPPAGAAPYPTDCPPI
ncbi:MAG: hypothetical protein CVU56_01220 [Deltaproteobacteria bacterium HGW-Deltaproteobacteria-14]|nr:MAG: hypothetical protein CVU56_01220 [Deltaproteobacteria bacterium HGW-Deltaproteobacteria-14]